MKPDWKDAPEWAQWLAQDHDGTWAWFEEQPDAKYSMWGVSSGRVDLVSATQWRDSLEGRPS